VVLRLRGARRHGPAYLPIISSRRLSVMCEQPARTTATIRAPGAVQGSAANV